VDFVLLPAGRQDDAIARRDDLGTDCPLASRAKADVRPFDLVFLYFTV